LDEYLARRLDHIWPVNLGEYSARRLDHIWRVIWVNI